MADLLTNDGLREALATELHAAIEAAVGSPLARREAALPSGAGHGVAITVAGALDGQLTVWFDARGVEAIAQAMLRTDDVPEAAVAADVLKELVTQALAATAVKGGDRLTLVAAPAVAGVLPAAGAGLALVRGETVIGTLVLTGEVTRVEAHDAGGPVRADYPGNLAALLDVDLPLVVRFARTEMSLKALAQLGPGSMVDMGRSPDAPVQVIVGTQVIAEGEVVVAGNYGVRITSLVSPADRLKAMDL